MPQVAVFRPVGLEGWQVSTVSDLIARTARVAPEAARSGCAADYGRERAADQQHAASQRADHVHGGPVANPGLIF